MFALRLFSFGRFELYYQDTPLPRPATLKSQSLLAYLACNRSRPSTRDHLINLFWGERPEQRARRSLSTALWHIRRCLPNEPFITADNQALQFTGQLWLDVDIFNKLAESANISQLETAVSLYRGDFLDGYYDEWVINERYYLHSRYLDTLRRLMHAYEAAGQPQQTLDTALRLLEQDPLQETANRTAMRSLARLGQRTAALEHFQRFQEIIRQELDIEPMPETVNLAAQIRSGRFPSESITLTPPERSQPVEIPDIPFSDNSTLPFFGRGPELAQLHTHWQQKRDSLLIVSGEAGAGKSRLLQEFVRQLPGTPALYGRCYEFERLLPYQPFAEALRPLLKTFSTADWQKLPAWAANELSRLLPELSETLPEQNMAGLQPDRTRLFSAVGRLLSLLAAQQPLLLILEDLHWATESTLQLLHFLVRQSVPSLLLIGTYRRELVGLEHPLADIRRQLGREKLAAALELPRLSKQAVEEIVSQMAGGKPAPELAGRLFAETEGNPFFLAETIHGLSDMKASSLETTEQPLPATITAAVLARLKRLPPDAQDALRITAVLGREFDFELLKMLWGRNDEAVLELIELWLRHFLIEEGTGSDGRDYAFSHHKIQEVLYAAIPKRRRQQLHARAAAAVESLYPPERLAGELAFHYLRGLKHDPALTPKAIHFLHQAGDQSAAQYAHSEAVAYFTQALALLPPDDQTRLPLLLAREKALDNQGNRTAQAGDLAEMAQLASEASAESQAAIALRRTNYAIVTSRYPEAIEYAQIAAAAESAELRTEALIQLSLAHYHQGQHESALSQIQEALKITQEAELLGLEARCLTMLGLVFWQQSRYDEAKSSLNAALTICRRPEINDRVGEGNALGNLGIIFRYQGSYSSARDYFQQALAVWQEMGHRRGESMYLTNLGVVAMDMADYPAARDFYQQALAIAREIGERENEQMSLNNLCAVSIYQGDYQEGLTLAQQALAICQEIGSRRSEAVSHMNLGDLTNYLGRLNAAQSHYEQALAIRLDQGDRRGEGLALCGLGEVAGKQGDNKRALKLLRQALAVLQEVADKAEECRALTSLAEALSNSGEFAESAVYLNQALQFSRQLNQPWLESRVRCNLARLALAQNDQKTALDQSQQALTLAQQIGAKSLQSDARTIHQIAQNH